MSIFQTALNDRAVIRIGGTDCVDFLQNLVTQNVAACPDSCMMAALLTPQGKLLYDFLLFSETDSFLLDCDASQAEGLLKKLGLYKLRTNVTLEPTDLQVHALWQEDAQPCPPMAGYTQDPRHLGLGLRGLFDGAPKTDLPHGALTDWHINRLRLGIAQGAQDMPPGQVFPLEFGLHHLNAIDFHKGCFVGQEVTSRVQRKGSLRKKLHSVRLEANASTGDEVMAADRVCGTLVALHGHTGLALIREDCIDKALTLNGAPLRVCGGVFNPTA